MRQACPDRFWLGGTGGPDVGPLASLKSAIIAGVAAGGGAIAYFHYGCKSKVRGDDDLNLSSPAFPLLK